jgi:hypothetical protein
MEVDTQCFYNHAISTDKFGRKYLQATLGGHSLKEGKIKSKQANHISPRHHR